MSLTDLGDEGCDRRSLEAGYSLVELLVAFALGLFLTAGIVQLLVSSQSSYRAEENFSRLQENARYATQAIVRDGRTARSLGCRSLMMDEVEETLKVHACTFLGNNCDPSQSFVTTDSALGIDNSQGGTQAVWDASLPEAATAGASGVDDRWIRGDVLVLWGVSGSVTYVQGDAALLDRQSDVPIEGPSNAALTTGDFVLVTDCVGSDLFQITNASANAQSGVDLEHAAELTVDAQQFPANAVEIPADSWSTLSRSYNYASGDAQVPAPPIRAMASPFEYRVYFICTSNVTGRDALCRWRPSDGIQDLVSDVRDIRVTYGGDADGDGTQDFFPDDAPPPTAKWVTDNGNWPGVYSAQVELLVASAEEVRGDAASPSDGSWPGGGADRLGAGLPDDRRLHQRTAVTVALRSRTPWYVAP